MPCCLTSCIQNSWCYHYSFSLVAVSRIHLLQFHGLYNTDLAMSCSWFLDQSNTAFIQQPPDHIVLQEVLGPDHQVDGLVPVPT